MDELSKVLVLLILPVLGRDVFSIENELVRLLGIELRLNLIRNIAKWQYGDMTTRRIRTGKLRLP